MGMLVSAETPAMGGLQGGLVLVLYVAVIAVFFFLMSAPQKKEKKRIEAMLSELAIGDSVLTTSGFYGMVIDINEEQNIVIVEFGSDRHCRIPMNKSAIAQVEKPDAE